MHGVEHETAVLLAFYGEGPQDPAPRACPQCAELWRALEDGRVLARQALRPAPAGLTRRVLADLTTPAPRGNLALAFALASLALALLPLHRPAPLASFREIDTSLAQADAALARLDDELTSYDFTDIALDLDDLEKNAASLRRQLNRRIP